MLNGWVGKELATFASGFLKIEGEARQNYRGADRELNPNMVPTADTKLRGGEQMFASVGVNLFARCFSSAKRRISQPRSVASH